MHHIMKSLRNWRSRSLFVGWIQCHSPGIWSTWEWKDAFCPRTMGKKFGWAAFFGRARGVTSGSATIVHYCRTQNGSIQGCIFYDMLEVHKEKLHDLLTGTLYADEHGQVIICETRDKRDRHKHSERMESWQQQAGNSHKH